MKADSARLPILTQRPHIHSIDRESACLVSRVNETHSKTGNVANQDILAGLEKTSHHANP